MKQRRFSFDEQPANLVITSFTSPLLFVVGSICVVSSQVPLTPLRASPRTFYLMRTSGEDSLRLIFSCPPDICSHPPATFRHNHQGNSLFKRVPFGNGVSSRRAARAAPWRRRAPHHDRGRRGLQGATALGVWTLCEHVPVLQPPASSTKGPREPGKQEMHKIMHGWSPPTTLRHSLPSAFPYH